MHACSAFIIHAKGQFIVCIVNVAVRAAGLSVVRKYVMENEVEWLSVGACDPKVRARLSILDMWLLYPDITFILVICLWGVARNNTDMSLDARKTVWGVSDQALHKSACTVT